MDEPFAAIARALNDLVREESHRIQLTQWLAARGQHAPVDIELGGWKERLAKLKAAAAIITALAPVEREVRALCPALRPDPPGELVPPTLWRGGETEQL